MATLKDALEGKPVRTPLHPGLVHLPIALFPLSLVLDVASHLTSTAAPLVPAAFVCLVVGIATALLAAVLGFVDYTYIRDDHPAKKTATAHLVLNLVAVGLFAASAGTRFGALLEPQTPALPLLLSVAGVVILGYSDYLGGVLVYDDGIGVGRHHRARLPQTTVSLKSDGQPVPVVAESELREGNSLRIEIDGVAAAVVRLGGAVYAFQDFCTHRYGPLSEGRLAGCEVTCPWHGSRFDVRTGRVTQGPARVDLRTFRTEVRDGKIWIHPPEQPATP